MADKQMILSISLRCVFIVEESMAYYLKINFKLRVEVELRDNDLFLLVYGRVVIAISAIATVQYY